MTLTKRHKVLRWLAILLACAGAAVLSLPAWFPWVLQPVLRHYGMRYGAYDRLGYTGFSLAGVKGRWTNISFEADRVQSVLPTAWLWQRFKRDTNGVPMMAAFGWRVLVEQSDAKARTTRTSSVFGILDRIVPVAAALQREAPLVQLTDGIVEEDAWRIEVPNIVWCEGRLSGRLRLQSFPETIQVSADLENESVVLLSASSEASGLRVETKLKRESEAWRMNGHAGWLTNQFAFSAGFDERSGWWPFTARLDAERLRVPANLVHLQGYDDPTASLTFNLISNQFELRANAIALPSNSSTTPMLPNIETALCLRGNPERATLEQFEIRTPWLLAELSNTFTIRKDGRLLENGPRLHVVLDLANLPQGSLKGKAGGHIQLDLTDLREPKARFAFSATNLAVWGLETAQMRVNGEFGWPVLTLGEFQAELGDGSFFWFAGASDVAARQVNTANWRFSGPFLAQRLAGLDCETFEASGRIEGAFSKLTHSGTLAFARAEVPSLKPFDARVRWQGTNLHFASTDVELSAGDSLLSLSGEWHLGSIAPTGIEARLKAMTLQRAGKARYSLVRPVAARFLSPASEISGRTWGLAVDGLEWRGVNRGIALMADLDWPVRGRATARADNVALGDFSDFISNAFTNTFLAALDLQAGWSNGPLRSVLTFDASQAITDSHKLSLSGELQWGEVLKLAQLTLKPDRAPALLIQGTVPISLTPGSTNGWWSRAGQGKLDLRASLKTVENVPLHLGTFGDARIFSPQLAIEAGGSLESPSVFLSLAVPRVEWLLKTNDDVRPALEALQLSAAASPSLIELKLLTAKLDGQDLHGQGKWPLPAGFWQELVKGKRPLDWSAANGHLKMTNAKLAALARHLPPSVLASEGNLSLDLALQPAKKFGGTVWLTNAATRPLGNVSPLREIAARLQFTGDQATLEEFRGTIGGQPVLATGRLQLDSERLGDFQLNLRGTNVPLARSLEFLLRGDFDLQLKGNDGLPAQLSGDVNLRDGLFVQSAAALMASRPLRPVLRPPYFSLTNEPFADWRLNVTIGGDQFLRVRTPVFNGVVSADLKLGGTMREPAATGDARVNSGRIVFPFGTLRVDQAHATLDGSDPRGPDLLMSASGRTYGYDLRLEATGPADGAKVSFSSTPPLSSEEILLMLTSGELPNDEHAFSKEARAGRLATYFGKDFLTRFTGSDTAGERFLINAGENLTEDGKTTYSLEYKLTDRWSLIGEYDRFSAVNASVKWKLFSR